MLIRQWGGTKHQVTVLERGVMFRGKRYRSLSEVARVDHRQPLVGAAVLRLKAGQGGVCDGAR